MSETGGDAPAPPAAVGAPPRPRVLAPRRISRGNLWGILQGRLHVPMGDLRRQFQIDSDDVTPIQTPEGTYYVGLPADGAAVLGQLWHEGRIVFDCTPDLSAMVVRAIAPTRPTRPPPTRTPLARTTSSRPVPVRAATVDVGVGTLVTTDQSTIPRSPGRTGPRVTGPDAVDEFLPVPNIDAFGLGDADAPPVTPGRAGPAPTGTVTDQEGLEPDGADDPPNGDDPGRRRRRGGIGRATRAR
ncbi:MAG: hypothetical protein KGS10_06515 [Chloroflexi bacterium]|jgi:hypothetical protein|nr:hypothetical protein [Chloroflexota bacterium]